MKYIFLFPLIVFTACCGVSATDVARSTIRTAAIASVQADRAFGSAYEIASTEARDTSTTQAEKDAKMVEWEAAADKFEKAYSATTAALAVGEVALDGVEQTGNPGQHESRTGRHDYWDEALACVGMKLSEIADILKSRGIHIPAALAKILDLTKNLVCSKSLDQ